MSNATRISLLLSAALPVAAAVAPGARGETTRPMAVTTTRTNPDPARATSFFADATVSSGLDFHHRNGMSGKHYFMEMMGSGGALLDYDGDGDLDLFLAQGRPPGTAPGAVTGSADRLYRNDLAAGGAGPTLRLVDVTARSGIAITGFAMGAASGDYDNDGRPDLYVTSWGANQLWRNQGDGTFSDVTEAAGVRELRWSVPAAFFDFDRDGWLDLFVGNYLDAGLENHKACHLRSAVPTYCSPTLFRPVPDRLWRNRGDGTFDDVTAVMGMAETYGPALGAAAADFDGDGWLDLYVANDQTANQLWINRAGSRFDDVALFGGAALDREGRPQASMGIAVADLDRDGDEDVFLSHLNGETSTLYVNDGRAAFEDRTRESGLAEPSLPYTGFGTGFLDLENDGDLDLYVVNGEVRTIERLYRAGDPYPLHQPNQLFRHEADGRYVDVTAEAGPELARSEVSRAALFGDLDNDGDTDVVVLNNNGPARLLLNTAGQDRPWIGLRLVTGAPGKPGRDALGARVELLAGSGGKAAPMVRRVATDGSYGAASDPRVLFGLGDAAGAVHGVRVRWPSGRVEDWTGLPVRRYTTVREGEGEEREPPRLEGDGAGRPPFERDR